MGPGFAYTGTVFTFLYFLSPVTTCKRVMDSKDVREFSAFPFAMGIFNCSIWVYYYAVTMASSAADLTPNLLINAVGLFMFIIYMFIFLFYAGSRFKEIARLLAITLFVEAIFIAFFEGVVPGLKWDFNFGKEPQPLKSSLSGLVCVIINVLLYGSPLAVMRMVIETKSVEFMPLPMSLLTFVICCLWSGQALLIQNPAVFIPNFLGILMGIAQLVLYACYCKTPQSRGCDSSRDVMLASTASA